MAAAAAQAETAVAFFSRWGGEAFDVSRADWYLRETEKALLRQLSAAFEKVVVERYPFGTDATLSLLCAERGDASEEPQVEIRSDKPVTVEIFWDEGRQSKTIAVNGT